MNQGPGTGPQQQMGGPTEVLNLSYNKIVIKLFHLYRK